MNDLPHLTLEAREDSQLPDAERILRIRASAGFTTTLPRLRLCV